MSEKVVLSAYDITMGMAKQMSMMFIGQQVDAVYHTSLVVYGKQYYFGGGICIDNPDQTPYGKPIQKIELGNTEIPKQLFEDYLKELNPKYSADNYHIVDHNCNHFTNEACEFLVGQGIPKRILNQAKQLLDTPGGQMIKPFLLQMQGAVQNPAPGMYK